MKTMILIIEDVLGSSREYAEYLLQAGFSVVASGVGQDAVNTANENLPDLVMLDVSTSGSGGIEAARTVARIHDVPVVLMTPLAFVQMSEYFEELPFIKYVLFKPCSDRTLLNVIDEVLSGQSLTVVK